MIGTEPDFMKSPFFERKDGEWHAKPGAPAKLVQEYHSYKHALKRLHLDDYLEDEFQKSLAEIEAVEKKRG